MAAHSMPTTIFDRFTFQEGDGSPLAQWVRGAALRFERWRLKRRDYQATMSELCALSDRELDDIGVVRANIPMIARQSADIAAARRL